MKKQDIVSFLITFGMGLCAGVYLYLVGFAGWATQFSVPDQQTISAFEVVGDMYGGCRSNCPSFQITGDGSYRYIYTPTGGGEQVLRQGTLPLQLQRSLRQTLTTRTLRSQSREISLENCNSFSDGIDVAYEITVDGTEYRLDSCGTAVDGDSELWLTLNEIWEYYQGLGNT